MARTFFQASWRFIITGAAMNIALLSLFALLLAIDIDYRVAMSMTYCLGTFVSFYINRVWSWKANNHIRKSLIWYISIYIITYILQINLIIILVSHMGISPLISGIFATIILIGPHLMMLNRFAFR